MHKIFLWLLFVALFLLSGCAHQQYSCEERCSKQAMVCSRADSCAAPGSVEAGDGRLRVDQQYKGIVKARSAADVKDAFNKKADQDSVITVIIGALVFVGLGIIAN